MASKKTKSEFIIVSLDETTVRLECTKCGKNSDFLQSKVITKSSKNEWTTINGIYCPKCGNTLCQGSVIKMGNPISQSEPHSKAGNKKNKLVDYNSKKYDDSNIGCIVWLIFIGLVVGIGMWLVTDGFNNSQLWYLIFPISIATFLVAGLIYSFATSDPQEIKQNWDKEKYNDYKFTCPMCGSQKVKKIGNIDRATSVAAWGLASSKIGKQYECDDCKHKW